MSGPRILAIDQGTTSSRAIVFDAGGGICAVAQREITAHYPQPGWVEHDAEEIWNTTVSVCREALDAAGPVAAVGITNQRETTVVWDRESGEAIHPAIVWQDRRTASQCDALEAEGRGALFEEKTGLRLDPYFSGTKVAWILDHVAGRGHAPSGAGSPSGPSTASSSGASAAAKYTRPTPPTPRAPCSSTSMPSSGTTRCSKPCGCPAPCCPRCATARARSASPGAMCSAPPSPSPGWPATSRRRPSARPASSPAWSSAPMAPGASR